MVTFPVVRQIIRCPGSTVTTAPSQRLLLRTGIVSPLSQRGTSTTTGLPKSTHHACSSAGRHSSFFRLTPRGNPPSSSADSVDPQREWEKGVISCAGEVLVGLMVEFKNANGERDGPRA